MNKRLIIIIVLTLVALAGIYFLVFHTYCETVGPISSGLKSSQEVFPGADNVNCKNYFKTFLMMFNRGPKNAERTTPSTSFGTKIDTADWKTYRNEKYGFEIKYPPNWEVSEKSMKTLNAPDLGGNVSSLVEFIWQGTYIGNISAFPNSQKLNSRLFAMKIRDLADGINLEGPSENNGYEITETVDSNKTKTVFFAREDFVIAIVIKIYSEDPGVSLPSEKFVELVSSTFKFTK